MNSDNRFGICCNCPARMSDGRIFTNWLSDERLNYYIQSANDIYDSTDYRLFLQQNAARIMAGERMFLDNSKRCNFNNIAKRM